MLVGRDVVEFFHFTKGWDWIKRVCKEAGIEEAELRNGGKRRKVFRVRVRISYYLSHEMGRPWRR